MTDSVKCLGFNELLEKEAKYLVQIKKWVLEAAETVEVLKQWQEEVFKNCPMPFDDKYFESGYTGTPVFISYRWASDFDEWKKDVFGEAFTRKGSLQEKKESQP